MTRFLYVLLVAVFLIFFAYLLITNSLPETSGEITLAILDEYVDVYRDSLGIPHIFAQNEDDLFRAMGYVTAQDRLWQMDFYRRVASGTLSEVLGGTALQADKFLRLWGFRRTAEEIIAAMSPECRRVVEAYADGVNAFIADHPNKLELPIEFSLLQYAPEPWKPEDSIAYARVMAWQLSFSWYTDLTLQALVDRLGMEKAAQVFPDFPEEGPFIISAASLHADVQPFLQAGLALHEILGVRGSQMGSNSWVVSSEKSASGFPLLANDPHLELTSPSIWYEVHLSGGPYEVAGVSLPGIPAVVIGHNRNAAWGLTNGMIDDVDFYVEKINPDDPSQYWDGRAWQKFEIIEEEIVVKDSLTVLMEIKRSRNGIVVSGMHPLLSGDSTVVSMRWTGHEPSDETRAYLNLMRAESWQDFTEAIRHFRVPAQNFVFASRAGDIGYYLGGSVPIRDGTTGILPHEGWQKQGQWSAYVDFEELPHILNPEQGYIATANNKIVDESYPYYLSNQWEPDSRIVRLHELLTSRDKFSLADFAAFQQDITSAYTNKLLPEIIADLENTPASDLSQEMKIMVALFKDWDGTESTQLLQPTLFHAFLVKIAENTFSDEMGDELYQQYIALGNVPTRVIAKLLTAENSPWFDDAQTETIETKHDIVLKSLHDARQLLIDLAGEDEGNWLWGDVHTLNMKHPLAVMRPLEILLNIGPVRLPGSQMTVSKAEYKFNAPFASVVGPSTRQLVDLSDPLHTLSVITTGQSGHPMSEHYSDQSTLWSTGGYHEMSMEHTDIIKNSEQHLVLEPGQ